MPSKRGKRTWIVVAACLLTVIVLWILNVTGLLPFHREAREVDIMSSYSEQVKKSEKVMDRYYRQDPVEEANASQKRAIDEFTLWQKQRVAELDAEDAALEKEFEPLRELEARISEIDGKLEQQKPDPKDSDSVDAYNRLVSDRNSMVRKQRERGQEFERKQTANSDRVREFNQEVEKRKAAAEAVKKGTKEDVDAYNRWRRERGPEGFSTDVNRLYASLVQERRAGKSSPELEECISKVKSIRRELGAHAQKTQEQIENGLLVVQTTLCDLEECYVTVDTGASVSSITPEMVDVLGIRDHVGEEVELSLPNAIRIKAPQLLLPKISAQGKEAEYVKAVVLKESMAGVDGSLGLSFLNRFDFTIDRDSLRLDPLVKAEGGPQFDVFICHKSGDLSCAKDVYDTLAKESYRPFLSEVSLPEVHTTDYQKAIDAAIDGAAHLVVVASSRESVEAPWVEAEWRLFEGLRRSGEKRGNIVPVLCGEMSPERLPLSLRHYQAVSTNDPDWKTTLTKYLPR